MHVCEWKDDYSVNVNEIDEQHKKLFAIINELVDAMNKQDNDAIIILTINRMKEYTIMHFTAEEKYMQKFNYAGYTLHKKEHTIFVDKISEFQDAAENGKTLVSIDMMNFLIQWIKNHVTHTDKKYQSCFNTHGLT